jgi:ABC-type uncharacterized transport system fused permease/ATPase subunit
MTTKEKLARAQSYLDQAVEMKTRAQKLSAKAERLTELASLIGEQVMDEETDRERTVRAA